MPWGRFGPGSEAMRLRALRPRWSGSPLMFSFLVARKCLSSRRSVCPFLGPFLGWRLAGGQRVMYRNLLHANLYLFIRGSIHWLLYLTSTTRGRIVVPTGTCCSEPKFVLTQKGLILDMLIVTWSVFLMYYCIVFSYEHIEKFHKRSFKWDIVFSSNINLTQTILFQN